MKFWLSLLSLICLNAFADDVVTIKGGREIHGQVNGETETHIDIYTDYGRQLHIHKTRIANIARAIPPAGDSNDRNVASGQNEEGVSGTKLIRKWQVGLELGMANSGVSINPAPATAPDSKTGVLAGLLAEYPLSTSVYFHPEIIYSQLGYKVNATSTMKYTFVKIPVMGKYRYPVGNKVNLNAFGGFSVGILTGAILESSTTKTDVSNTTKSAVYGLELGLGGDYVFSEKTNIFLNVRYAMALNSIDNTPGDPRTYKLHDLDVLFGILYRI